MPDAITINHLFNFFFFSFALVALYGLWWKIFKKEQSEQKDKGLFWLSVSVGFSLLSSAWWLLVNEIWPEMPYVCGVALPMTIFSTLNSIFIIKALQHFEYKSSIFKEKEFINILLAIGWIVIFISIILHLLFQHTNVGANDASNSTDIDEQIQDSASSFISRASATEIRSIMGGDNLPLTSTRLNIEDIESGLIDFKLKTRIADSIYSAFISLLLLYFLLLTFKERNYKVLWWLGITFMCFYAISQMSPYIDDLKRYSSSLFLVVNAVQVLFYLLVLLTWALEKLKQKQASDEYRQGFREATQQVEGQSVESAFIGDEKLKMKLELLDELQRKILIKLCQGLDRLEIGKLNPDKYDDDSRKKWVADQLEVISKKIQIENKERNHILYALKSGLVTYQELEFSPKGKYT